MFFQTKLLFKVREILIKGKKYHIFYEKRLNICEMHLQVYTWVNNSVGRHKH